MTDKILTLKDLAEKHNLKTDTKELYNFIKKQEQKGLLTRKHRVETENNEIFDLTDQEAQNVLKTGKFLNPITKQQFDMLHMDIFPVWKE